MGSPPAWTRAAIAALAALPLTCVYAIATGAGPPVLRAAIAAAVILVGTAAEREPDAANTLALAALVLLAADPGGALDVSLQLSFAAVAGLAAWAGPLRRALPIPRAARGTWRARLLEPLVGGACASAAASLAAAPVLALHFRQLPVLGLLANVAAVPIGSGLTIAATLAALAASAAPALAAALLAAARPLASALLAVSDLAAAPRLAVVGVGSPGLAGVVGFYAAAAVATRARGPRRLAAWTLAAACLLAPAHLRAAAAGARGGLELLFLSVGQGDAALLRLPDGSAVLVDAGGAADGGADPGARDIVPLLRDLGVTRLAAVFVSHPHPDHVLGLAAVADAIPIDLVFSNGDPGEGEAARILAALAPIAASARRRVGARGRALRRARRRAGWARRERRLARAARRVRGNFRPVPRRRRGGGRGGRRRARRARGGRREGAASWQPHLVQRSCSRRRCIPRSRW